MMTKLLNRLRRTGLDSRGGEVTQAIQPTKLSFTDLVSESLSTLTLRPGRTLLTVLGTIIGVGAFVAVLGLTATASGQISSAFSIWDATQVTVDDAGAKPDDHTVYSFPDDADARAERINGIVAAGRTWSLPDIRSAVANLDPRTRPVQVSVAAVSPGYLRALEPTYLHGRGIDNWEEVSRQPVTVVGASVARTLNITTVNPAPGLYLKGTRYTVVGILSDVRRNPAILNAVLIPTSTALNTYGPPSNVAAARMLVATQPGAADVVASQLALALRPDRPEVMRVAPPPPPPQAASQVTDSLNAVFLTLAGLTLVIGTVGIANTTLVSVLERTGEIGLRRALGARPRDILTQVLTETGVLGAIGGLVGTALAVTVVVITALVNNWTALLNPWVTLAAPLIGAATGLLAGSYPAAKAARIPPLEALRR